MEMKKAICILTSVILLVLPALGFSASFKVYPGSKLEDVYETKQSEIEAKISKAPKVIIFTTSDPFESVVAYYRGIVREYRMPGGGKSVKLSSGQELKEAYFIFDNAADLSSSKHWIKIQWPYRMKGGFQGRYEIVREVTAIIEEDKRTYP
ncbi:MAG: hypothetical protein ACXWM6_06220 [Thermodesulfobacteriota bacterium]